MKYNRILLKLSGESLMGESNFGISSVAIHNYATEISQLHKLGVQVGIVIGGGNYYRGRQAQATGISKVTGDKMGMLATIMNGLALRDIFEKIDIKSRILTSLSIPQFANIYNQEYANKQLQKGRIVIFAGGTGNPLFTTDSAAALRAVEIGADILIKATNVDGVYDSDPRKNSAAKMYKTLTYQDCVDKDLKVMDMTAFVLCKENNMPIAVINIQKGGNLLDFANGGELGTLIK